MTHLRRIQSQLAKQPDLCDDCLAALLDIKPRQTVNSQCRRIGNMIKRGLGICSQCKAEKITNQFETHSQPQPSGVGDWRKERAVADHLYQREEDLREKLNGSLASALGLPSDEYYSRLDIPRLLALKECLARVHDVVTLKLTLALVKWVAGRFSLTDSQTSNLVRQVNQRHPNESGFDLDIPEINLVAEVKGTIPMNRNNSFGSAQVKSLTNDIRQMLGKPPLGKELNKLSIKSKVRRAGLESAVKILCLCDRPEVRAATTRWSRNVMTALDWREVMGDFRIEEMPDSGELVPQAVYLLHLEPEHHVQAIDRPSVGCELA